MVVRPRIYKVSMNTGRKDSGLIFLGKRGIDMKMHRMIRLNRESAREFVRVCSHCDFDIDIANGNSSSYIVDAKSMLGVIGLDLSTALVVSYDGYNEDLENFLNGNAAVA